MDTYETGKKSENRQETAENRMIFRSPKSYRTLSPKRFIRISNHNRPFGRLFCLAASGHQLGAIGHRRAELVGMVALVGKPELFIA
jgi:hypothetical protein